MRCSDYSGRQDNHMQQQQGDNIHIGARFRYGGVTEDRNSLRCKVVGIGLRVDSIVDFDFNCKIWSGSVAKMQANLMSGFCQRTIIFLAS
jgi:hypothetical protein